MRGIDLDEFPNVKRWLAEWANVRGAQRHGRRRRAAGRSRNAFGRRESAAASSFSPISAPTPDPEGMGRGDLIRVFIFSPNVRTKDAALRNLFISRS